MQCPRCKVEMTTGFAIVKNGDPVLGRACVFSQFTPVVEEAHKELYFVNKCPKCGISDWDHRQEMEKVEI